jgi:hypothetical protein
VFDYEHEKDRPEDALLKSSSFRNGDENYFMRNPMLYRIGMEHSCFGKM